MPSHSNTAYIPSKSLLCQTNNMLQEIGVAAYDVVDVDLMLQAMLDGSSPLLSAGCSSTACAAQESDCPVSFCTRLTSAPDCKTQGNDRMVRLVQDNRSDQQSWPSPKPFVKGTVQLTYGSGRRLHNLRVGPIAHF